MVRLLAPTAGIVPQFGIEPEAIDRPQTIDLLAESQRCVVLRQEEDDILSFGNGFGPDGVAELLGGRGSLHPYLDDGNRSDKGGDEASGGGAS